MSQPARFASPGDAEVPILVHSTTSQPALGSGNLGHATRTAPDSLWADKSFGHPQTSVAAISALDQGLLHVPASPSALPHSMAHLVPQMSTVGGKPSGARLTRAQQSELEMARRRAQKAAQGKAANTASARRAKRRASDGEAASDDELQQKLAGVTDEKEAKRLKRLLRNRVSAQQARERKKSYVATLEEKCKAQGQRLEEAEQRIKTLERENVMLRSVMKNMQGHPEVGPGDLAQDEAAVPRSAAGWY